MDADTLSIATKAINTVIALAVLPYGLANRRRPKVHIPVMLTAFGVDVINVLLVEYFARSRHGKGAVEQGVAAFSGGGTFLERFHIIVSLLCVLGYVVAGITGRRLYRRGRGRKVHKGNAVIFLFTRYASYITSFWM